MASQDYALDHDDADLEEIDSWFGGIERDDVDTGGGENMNGQDGGNYMDNGNGNGNDKNNGNNGNGPQQPGPPSPRPPNAKTSPASTSTSMSKSTPMSMSTSASTSVVSSRSCSTSFSSVVTPISKTDTISSTPISSPESTPILSTTSPTPTPTLTDSSETTTSQTITPKPSSIFTPEPIDSFSSTSTFTSASPSDTTTNPTLLPNTGANTQSNNLNSTLSMTSTSTTKFLPPSSIAAIVIGILAFLALVFAALWYILRNKRRNRENNQHQNISDFDTTNWNSPAKGENNIQQTRVPYSYPGMTLPSTGTGVQRILTWGNSMRSRTRESVNSLISRGSSRFSTFSQTRESRDAREVNGMQEVRRSQALQGSANPFVDPDIGFYAELSRQRAEDEGERVNLGGDGSGNEDGYGNGRENRSEKEDLDETWYRNQNQHHFQPQPRHKETDNSNTKRGSRDIVDFGNEIDWIINRDRIRDLERERGEWPLRGTAGQVAGPGVPEKDWRYSVRVNGGRNNL